MKDSIQPIDIVIAWVDGQDLNLKHKRQQFINQSAASNAIEATRFASNDEIYFCIASILKYVPYCGKIYVVTDQQSPQWLDQFEQQNLCEKDKIRIIDHTELFEGHESALPTFNSLSIETMLWNIRGLSEHFIYLNDDFFFNSPSNIHDFLDAERMVIYGHWQNNFIKKMKYLIRRFLQEKIGKIAQPKYSIAQMLSADLVGLTKYYEIHHRPHILNKMILTQYFQQYPSILEKQISFRFRHIDQFLPVGLSNHLAISSNQTILKDDIEIAYLKDDRDIQRFIDQLARSETQFGCIQSLDQLEQNAEQKVRSALIDKFKDVLPNQIQASIAV
ncbi:capsular polysaccharide biosynthesis protein [Acinetobacter sp. 2JN-4]|uniref:Stealth CR1 domain-containing protein n=1 Tax=Acinetobacter sp. 2JN-4 TaxID=2479844 RepID=UPI000EF9BEE0|nr:Stealth CR1 domain-containing protein [Acinetobacter sp. 2JN-4]RLZ11321.1 capsular polysaccharide biosynthesis protein [Acinetobacter sp. 2JN-4]